MGLSRYEQEVIINFNAEEEHASLYTANPVWIRKMDKLLKQNPDQFRLGRVERVKGEVVSKEYIFPKRFVSIRSRDIKRVLTEEQRQELAERLRNSREMDSALQN